MAEDRYVGVSWSDGSWLAVAFTADGYEETVVAEGIGDIWARYEEDTRLILVDVPIGLVQSGDPRRRCDALARSVLGPRAGALVDPPVREATRKRRYSTAKRVHERKADATLAEDAFALSEGIAMCDELLQEVPEAAAVVRGSHPELCFRAFAPEPLDHDVRVADVLNAVVLAYTARPGEGNLRSLPAEPPTDASGRPMELVYRADAPLAEK